MKKTLLVATLAAVLAMVAVRSSNPRASSRAQLKTRSPRAEIFRSPQRQGRTAMRGKVAPAGAVNQGPFDNAKWKYGTAFNAPAGARSGIR